jgi:dTMP kinase
VTSGQPGEFGASGSPERGGRTSADNPPVGQILADGAPTGAAPARQAGSDSGPPLVSSARKIRGVLRRRDFRRLWLVMSFSSFGDWLGLLATTALAAELAGSYRAANFALGGVLIVRLLPAAILGPVAGAFADRFDRRRTMVAADTIRFLLFVSIPIAGSLWWLLVASFLIECVALFWIPAKDASVPNLVRREQLETANQLSLITTYGITPVAAAGVFSLLALVSRVLAESVPFFRTNQVDLALYINALTFLVSALTVLRIRRITAVRARREEAGAEVGLLRLLREGWAFVGRTRLVRGLVLGLVGAFSAAGAVIGTGKIYAASLGGGDATYGVLFGALFIGLGLGIGLGPRVARDLSRRRLFGLSIVFAGACLVLASLMPHLALSVVTVIGVGFGAGIAYLSGTTLLGQEVADEVRGRTFAFVQSLIRVDLILSVAAAPFLVGVLRQRRMMFGAVDFTVDGTRIVLSAAGLLAIVGGMAAYRYMDDRRGIPVVADVVSAMRGDTTARRRLIHGGVLIAFEGGEGSGKSTQAERLAEWLREHSVAVTVTHEPGATDFGARIREVLLNSADGGLTPRAEALLFAADRAHHVDTVIRPALDRGDVVITDRYIDSSLAYQGAGRALGLDDIRRLSRWATSGLEPDLTVLLDVDPELGLDRARSRAEEDSTETPPGDRLERESLEFHRRVRQTFRALADAAPDRYVVVDSSRHPEAVAALVRGAVGKRLAAARLAGTSGPRRRSARHRHRHRWSPPLSPPDGSSRPAASGPAASDPAGGGPAGGGPAASDPGGGGPGAGGSSASAPDADRSGAGAPGAGAPDAGAPDAGAPSAGAPSASAAGTGAPDAGAPGADGTAPSKNATASARARASAPGQPADPAQRRWS